MRHNIINIMPYHLPPRMCLLPGELLVEGTPHEGRKGVFQVKPRLKERFSAPLPLVLVPETSVGVENQGPDSS